MEEVTIKVLIILVLLLCVIAVWITAAQPPAYSELDLAFMRADLITICIVRMEKPEEWCIEAFDDIIEHMPDETRSCYSPYKDDWTDYRNGVRIISCITDEMEKQ